MSQETVIYLTNIIIIAILALLITQQWLTQGRSRAVRAWMVAAWVMLAADILFAARAYPELPRWFSRILPTLMVTIGQAILLIGARRTANLRTNPLIWSSVIVVHLAGLVAFFEWAPQSEWRKVFNGLVWAGLSIASYLALRKAVRPYWAPLQSPATAFLLHGVFHGLRVILASVFSTQHWPEADAWLQTVGDLEVSFFMVALFVSFLVACLQVRNEELSHALTEVHTLAGLLPICAWCKKVRNDDGYWQKVEDYLATHSQIKFTHGICSECYSEHSPNQAGHAHGVEARPAK